MTYLNGKYAVRIIAVLCLAAGTAAANSFPNPAQVIRHAQSSPSGIAAIEGMELRPAPLVLASNSRRVRWRGAHVKELAHDLVCSLRETKTKYRKEKPGNFFKKISWRSAYSEIGRMLDAAEHFHHQIERNHSSRDHSWNDYMRLADVYNSASGTVPYGYHFSRIRSEWRRSVEVMRDLDSAFAGGSGWGWSTVKRLAHEVHEAAEHVHHQAEQSTHHGDYWEERAVEDLHTLEQKAGHLHSQLERFRQNPSHTDRDYRALIRAYDAAERSMRWAHAFGHIKHDFNRVGHLIEELEDHFSGGHGGGHERDRDDHGRRH